MHVKGTDNLLADYMSRVFPEASPETQLAILHMCEHYTDDTMDNTIHSLLFMHQSFVADYDLLPTPPDDPLPELSAFTQLLTPQQMFENAHSKHALHPGVRTTMLNLHKLYPSHGLLSYVLSVKNFLVRLNLGYHLRQEF